MAKDYLNELFGLDGQTAVVIGGAGVLGGALCSGLVQAGARVIVGDLIEAGCQARVAQLQELGGQAGYCTVNVTQRESIEHLLAATLEQTGRADITSTARGSTPAPVFSTPPTPIGIAFSPST